VRRAAADAEEEEASAAGANCEQRRGEMFDRAGVERCGNPRRSSRY
jgi:hypothetical protein